MLGVRESLAELLPEDGKAQGFDNVGEALDLSAVHLERYMKAAGKAIDPPGFAVENYDVMGGWREHYRSLNRDFPMPSPEQRGDTRTEFLGIP